ncbi:MAG: ATP-grasp fold amidoligase family protein [Culicoidibacterales bacterium]
MNKKVYTKILKFFPNNIAILIHTIHAHKYIPNLINPKKFNDKIASLKMTNWLEDKGLFVDKYKVRTYIADKIGQEYLPDLYNFYKSSEQFNLEELPKSFVLKLNNGSGCNLIVKDKTKIDEQKTKKTIDQWLDTNYYKQGREKQYKNIEQIVICEEYLEDNSGNLRDYKFWVFNGQVKFIEVYTGRKTESATQSFYDLDWKKLDFSYTFGENNVSEEKPEKLSEMAALAEALGKDFPFVRADFYYTNNKIYFGELTFTPNNGLVKFKPKEKELEIGSWLDLNNYKNS